MREKLIRTYQQTAKKWLNIQKKELEGKAAHFICKLSRRERDRLRKMSQFRKMRELKGFEFFIGDSGNLIRPKLNYFLELYWFDTGNKNMAIHQLFENQVNPKEIYFPYGHIEVEPATAEHFEKAEQFILEVIPEYMSDAWIENEISTHKREIKRFEEAQETQLTFDI